MVNALDHSVRAVEGFQGKNEPGGAAPTAGMRAIKQAPLAFWVLDLWSETLQAIGEVRPPEILHDVGKMVPFIYKRCDLILAQSNGFILLIQKYVGNSTRVQYFSSWAESVSTCLMQCPQTKFH